LRVSVDPLGVAAEVAIVIVIIPTAAAAGAVDIADLVLVPLVNVVVAVAGAAAVLHEGATAVLARRPIRLVVRPHIPRIVPKNVRKSVRKNVRKSDQKSVPNRVRVPFRNSGQPVVAVLVALLLTRGVRVEAIPVQKVVPPLIPIPPPKPTLLAAERHPPRFRMGKESPHLTISAKLYLIE